MTQDKEAADWRSRILRHDSADPAELLANPFNHRLHNQIQRDAVAGLLDSVGWVKSVVVNVTTGHIVDGHLRVSEALERGEAVPVEYVELTEDEEKLVLASLDYIVTLADVDDVRLEELLTGIETESESLMTMLAGMRDENARIPAAEPLPRSDAVPQVSRSKDLGRKYETDVGQIWRFKSRTDGRYHFLSIGDSRYPAVVLAASQGDEADLAFLDPPYNIRYLTNERKDKDANRAQLKKRNMRTDDGFVLNDDMDDDAFYAMLVSIFEAAPLKAGGSWYICSPPGEPERLFRNAIHDAGIGPTRQAIAWVKDRFVYGRQDYHWQHENLLYGWKKGAGHYFTDDRSLTTVWNHERPAVSDLFPTIKPTDLVERAVENSSRPGELVYDGVAGSGTTLVAAENLGRRASLVELEPDNAAVIIERYLDAFGILAERVAL